MEMVVIKVTTEMILVIMPTYVYDAIMIIDIDIQLSLGIIIA